MGTLVYRALGAAALNASTYEWVESDRPATWQAFVVVLLSSVAAAAGAGGLDGPNPAMLAVFTLVALFGWLSWAALIQYVGGGVFPGRRTRVDFGQLVRTIGFAASPGVIQALAMIPSIRIPVFIIAWLWMLAAMVIAVRQALDYDRTSKALGVCAITLAVVLATAIAIGLATGQTVT